MVRRIILSLFVVLLFAEDFILEDLNPSSPFFSQEVGPSFFPNEVYIVYFGHFGWGTCTARFEQLNNLYNQMNLEGYTQVKFFGVAKTNGINDLSNWTDGNDAMVAADSSPYPYWSDWDADQRDLYVLDHEKQIIFHENVTNGLNEEEVYSIVVDLINNIPNDIMLGDINGDETLNVLDIVMMINMILSNEYSLVADVNEDGFINVLDVVVMVNILVGGLP